MMATFQEQTEVATRYEVRVVKCTKEEKGRILVYFDVSNQPQGTYGVCTGKLIFQSGIIIPKEYALVIIRSDTRCFPDMRVRSQNN